MDGIWEDFDILRPITQAFSPSSYLHFAIFPKDPKSISGLQAAAGDSRNPNLFKGELFLAFNGNRDDLGAMEKMWTFGNVFSRNIFARIDGFLSC